MGVSRLTGIIISALFAALVMTASPAEAKRAKYFTNDQIKLIFSGSRVKALGKLCSPGGSGGYLEVEFTFGSDGSLSLDYGCGNPINSHRSTWWVEENELCLDLKGSGLTRLLPTHETCWPVKYERWHFGLYAGGSSFMELDISHPRFSSKEALLAALEGDVPSVSRMAGSGQTTQTPEQVFSEYQSIAKAQRSRFESGLLKSLCLTPLSGLKGMFEPPDTYISPGRVFTVRIPSLGYNSEANCHDVTGEYGQSAAYFQSDPMHCEKYEISTVPLPPDRTFTPKQLFQRELEFIRQQLTVEVIDENPTQTHLGPAHLALVRISNFAPCTSYTFSKGTASQTRAAALIMGYWFQHGGIFYTLLYRTAEKNPAFQTPTDKGTLSRKLDGFLKGLRPLGQASSAAAGGGPAAVPVRTPSPEMLEANKWYVTLMRQRNYQDALPFAEKAARLAEGYYGPNDAGTAVMHLYVANLRQLLGQPDKAEAIYRQWMPVLENAIREPRRPTWGQLAEVRDLLGQYAGLLRQIGKRDEWEKVVARAHAVTARLETKHPDAAAMTTPRFMSEACAKAFREAMSRSTTGVVNPDKLAECQ